MKTTIDLPDDLVREAKLRAVAQGQTLKDLIADFIRQGLGHPAQPALSQVAISKHVGFTPDGLPQILCRANAPASWLRVQGLLALEQRALADEDLSDAGRAV